MSSIALLVGNSQYAKLRALDCCHADVAAIQELVEATGKYTPAHVIENADADALKAKIRDALDRGVAAEEVFFYFSGHGVQTEDDFYFCATNFDINRPNETGLSNAELHELLRLADANLVVRVVDACNSGTLVLKSDGAFIPVNKAGFRNVIQISACLDSQNAMAGNPLSPFTEKFRLSVLRKHEGPVYYTDIVNTLRDEFRDSATQTPHYFAQGTAREKFVEDAACFSSIREAMQAAAAPAPEQLPVVSEPSGEMTLLAQLDAVEARLVGPEKLQTFVNAFFEELRSALETEEFAKFFESAVVEHADFSEPTARAHIIRVLHKETRPDNFVTAKVHRKLKRKDPFGFQPMLEHMAMFGDDDAVVETFELDLNCAMDRVQMKLTLTPRYKALKRMCLVVSCAPSLTHCYVFEMATQHELVDFGKYDAIGHEVSRKWYKPTWDEKPSWMVKQIKDNLLTAVRGHIQGAAARLSKGDDG